MVEPQTVHLACHIPTPFVFVCTFGFTSGCFFRQHTQYASAGGSISVTRFRKIIDFEKLPVELVRHIVHIVVQSGSCSSGDVCPVVLACVSKTFFEACGQCPCRGFSLPKPGEAPPIVQLHPPGAQNTTPCHKQHGRIDMGLAVHAILQALGMTTSVRRIRDLTLVFLHKMHNVRTNRQVVFPPFLLYTWRRHEGRIRRLVNVDIAMMRRVRDSSGIR